MSVDATMIRDLREQTSCGVMDCKKALQEANGDFNKAKELLRERGLKKALKKSDREANQGRVEAYIHAGNKIGVLLELNCETDFVAKNEDFIAFSRELAMHIAAMAPEYIKEGDVPETVLSEADDQKAFLKEKCLLNQPFVKDAGKSIQDMLNELVAKIGENIQVSNFSRFQVG